MRPGTPTWYPRASVRNGCAAVMVAAVSTGLASCSPQARTAPDLSNAANLAEAQSALLPTRLTIHPLTRIGVDSSGEPALLLHVELRDRFEQNTRALGRLRVLVQRSGSDPVAASVDPSGGVRAWDVDLRDPDRNATLYDDLITRTYSLTLTGLPDWLVEWGARRGEGSGGGAPTVVATFSFPDPRDPAAAAASVSDSARLGR